MVDQVDHVPRIIPASAGSTFVMPENSIALTDHPRVCGEHATNLWLNYLDRGSSPRLRGARQPGRPDQQGSRIIPASAGSTRPRHRDTPRHPDHPRVCGEHVGDAAVDVDVVGSSPRLRGALHHDPSRTHGGRIIPASAGSTAPAPPRMRRDTDHPRVCGEHDTLSEVIDPVCGSSPRLRGARAPRWDSDGSKRIIPASAGSTTSAPSSRTKVLGSSPRLRGALSPVVSASALFADHPRVCGEHLTIADLDQFKHGSSPRLRGARICQLRPVPPRRIIPASAGSTPAKAKLSSSRTDHPRVCGEHQSRIARDEVVERIIPASAGSTRSSANPDTPVKWIIPASAGSTAWKGTGTRFPTGSSPRLRGAPFFGGR